MSSSRIRLLILCISVLLYIGTVFSNPWLFKLIIGPAYLGKELSPFLDMYGQLASAQAWAAGFDVLNNANPIDLLNRPHHGPTWMLLMGYLGIGVEHTNLLSIISIVGVLFIGFTIFKPANWLSVLLGFLALCSPSMIFAYERANIDITLFCVLSIAAYFVGKSTKNSPPNIWLAWAAWSIIVLNIGFKYFPTAAFLILVNVNFGWRRFLAFTISGALALATYLLLSWQELLWVKEQVSGGISHLTFGGAILFRLLDVSEQLILPLCIGAVITIFITGTLLAAKYKIEVPNADGYLGVFYILSASTTIFCFATNVSFDYRLVFLLPAFPLLINSLWEEKRTRFIQTLSVVTLCLLYFQMWADSAFFFIGYNPSESSWNGQYSSAFLILKSSLSWILFTLLGWILTFIIYPQLTALVKDWQQSCSQKLKVPPKSLNHE